MTDKIMIAPGYFVPRVSQETLSQVFGDRTLQRQNVEFAEVAIEYWLAPGIPNSIARTKILEILLDRINAGNIYDLISLLSKRGFVQKFFDLTDPAYDRDGSLRNFLTTNNAEEAFRFYEAWRSVDPSRFIAGFTFGVGESFASIILGIVDIIKLSFEMHKAILSSTSLLLTDFQSGLRQIEAGAKVIGEIFVAVLKLLNPLEFPSHAVKIWHDWNDEFVLHLENLDAFSAGRTLGRIAGDLYQILQGIKAIAQLTKIGYQLALNYTPMLVGRIVNVAAEAKIVIAKIVAFLKVISKQVIDKIPKVGMGILDTLFSSRVLEALAQGRAFIQFEELSATLLPQFAYEAAYGIDKMGAKFGVMIGNNNGPICMAAVTEIVPSVSKPPTDRFFDAGSIKKLISRFEPLEKPMPASEAALAAERAKLAIARVKFFEQGLETKIAELLKKIAYRTFVELSKRDPSGKELRKELGRIIHAEMPAPVEALAKEMSPEAKVFAENSIKTVVSNLKGEESMLDGSIAKLLLKRDDAEDLLKLISVDEPIKSEKGLAKFLSSRFGWKETVTAGELRNDLAIADPITNRLVLLDYTSSTKLDQFEQTFRKLAKDLSNDFDGDWTKLAEAYRRKGQEKVPQEIAKGLDYLTAHAQRETIIRKAIFESALGKDWVVISNEMLYDSIDLLYNPEKAAAKKLLR